MRSPANTGFPKGDCRLLTQGQFWEPSNEKRQRVPRRIIEAFSMKKKPTSLAPASPKPAVARRTGKWTEGEDACLIEAVDHARKRKNGKVDWCTITRQIGGGRSVKQVRERHKNYLDSNLAPMPFTDDELTHLRCLVGVLGKSWSTIAVVHNRWRADCGMEGIRTATQIRNKKFRVTPPPVALDVSDEEALGALGAWDARAFGFDTDVDPPDADMLEIFDIPEDFLAIPDPIQPTPIPSTPPPHRPPKSPPSPLTVRLVANERLYDRRLPGVSAMRLTFNETGNRIETRKILKNINAKLALPQV